MKRCNCLGCTESTITERRKDNPGGRPKHGRKAKRTQHGYTAYGAFDRMLNKLGDRQRKRMALAPDEGAPWRVTRPKMPWEEKKDDGKEAA